MGEEAARADEALRRAAAGARVALVSSGDAGVHGMAARTLARAAELAEDERPTIEVVPGVTAALAAGALLGAPLGDDFAALSLSDLQVAWEVVERRLTAVAAAGLALALYNPRSRDADVAARPRARAPARAPRRATRRSRSSPTRRAPAERVERATLATLDTETVTMRSLLVVAGDSGRAAGPWLVAERGAGVPRMTRHRLVGAGPGDPALLTGAARDALARADVVVYDRPSLDEVVALAPAGAERHCVGLAPGQRALPQAEVNALLVELGRAPRRGRAAEERRPVRRLARRRGGARAARGRHRGAGRARASRPRSPRRPRPASRSCCASSASR